MTTVPPLRTVGEVAQQLRCSCWTVRLYAKTGRLRAARIGKRLLFRDEVVQDFIRAAEGPAAQAPAGTAAL
jgi:excisionase family DNA binding protein